MRLEKEVCLYMWALQVVLVDRDWHQMGECFVQHILIVANRESSKLLCI